ncbi:hypothetical protein ACROYT_G029311 [Oculina patagonica]
MASSARGKFARLLPSFLHTRAYCNAVARENYLYHPKSRPLEPEVQTLNLTKTIHMGDISSCLLDSFLDPSTKEAMMSKFRQNIIQTRLINFEGEIATRDTCALPLMQNMLRVVWSYTNSFPGLLDTSLTYKPHVSAYWEREHMIQVSGYLGFLISSKNQLKQVADSEEVQKTKDIHVEKPDIISPVFHLNPTKSKAKFETGFYGNAPFPYPHTFIIVCEDTKWNTNQLVGQGIMFSCARLVAEAVEKHNYQLGDELEKPLTTQCILTDGIRLSFITYQLNTLRFSDDDGVKNMAWISPGVFMYKRAIIDDIEKREKSAKERKRFRLEKKDPAKHEIVLEEFNDDCFETFARMIVNGC